jgi:hypothetical protein
LATHLLLLPPNRFVGQVVTIADEDSNPKSHLVSARIALLSTCKMAVDRERLLAGKRRGSNQMDIAALVAIRRTFFVFAGDKTLGVKA